MLLYFGNTLDPIGPRPFVKPSLLLRSVFVVKPPAGTRLMLQGLVLCDKPPRLGGRNEALQRQGQHEQAGEN